MNPGTPDHPDRFPIAPLARPAWRRLIASAAFAGAVLAAAPLARAALIGSHSLEAGVGIGEIKGGGDSADLTALRALWNRPLITFGFGEIDLRAGYLDLREDGGPIDFSAQDLDVDLYLGTVQLAFLRPYAFAGISYDKYEAGGGGDWETGYNVGAGIEFDAILFTITPAVRYSDSDAYQSTTYSLDVSYWFTRFGLGLNLARTEFDDSDVTVDQGIVYGSIRF